MLTRTQDIEQERRQLIARLKDVTAQIKLEIPRANSYGYLATILTYLDAVAAYLEDPLANSRVYSGNLGILLTDSTPFMESDLGINIVVLVDDYAHFMQFTRGKFGGAR